MEEKGKRRNTFLKKNKKEEKLAKIEKHEKRRKKKRGLNKRVPPILTGDGSKKRFFSQEVIREIVKQVLRVCCYVCVPRTFALLSRLGVQHPCCSHFVSDVCVSLARARGRG